MSARAGRRQSAPLHERICAGLARVFDGDAEFDATLRALFGEGERSTRATCVMFRMEHDGTLHALPWRALSLNAAWDTVLVFAKDRALVSVSECFVEAHPVLRNLRGAGPFTDDAYFCGNDARGTALPSFLVLTLDTRSFLLGEGDETMEDALMRAV